MHLASSTVEKQGLSRLQANFLSWHRYFVWTYETALREECGYKGYQPVSRLDMVGLNLISYSTGTGANLLLTH
jgi:hypothetical protein